MLPIDLNLPNWAKPSAMVTVCQRTKHVLMFFLLFSAMPAPPALYGCVPSVEGVALHALRAVL